MWGGPLLHLPSLCRGSQGIVAARNVPLPTLLSQRPGTLTLAMMSTPVLRVLTPWMANLGKGKPKLRRTFRTTSRVQAPTWHLQLASRWHGALAMRLLHMGQQP